MSSQKQWKRTRNWERIGRGHELDIIIGGLRDRVAWLERRPPWWRFRAVKRWREEEPV